MMRERRPVNYQSQLDDDDSDLLELGPRIDFTEVLTKFPSYRQGAVRRLNAEQLTSSWLQQHGTVRPVIIPASETSTAHLDMQITSSEDITSAALLTYLSPHLPVNVLDTDKQKPGPSWTLNQWNLYWSAREGGILVETDAIPEFCPPAAAEDDDADSGAFHKRGQRLKGVSMESCKQLYDLLPLSISAAETPLFVPPAAVRAVDMTASTNKLTNCISMSPKGAFRDFKLPPGGASTWIHVFQGKIAYALLPPTRKNLQAYVDHCTGTAEHQGFLASICESVAFIELSAGDTLIVPPGWVQASAVTVSATVACGAVLRQDSLPVHLEAWKIEEHLGVALEDRYPGFKSAMWHVANRYTNKLKPKALEAVEGDASVIASRVAQRKIEAAKEERIAASKHAELVARRAAIAARQAAAAQAKAQRAQQRKRKNLDDFIETESDDDDFVLDDAELEWNPADSEIEDEAEDDDEYGVDDDYGEGKRPARPTRGASGGRRREVVAQQQQQPVRTSTRFKGRVPDTLAAVLDDEYDEDFDDDVGGFTYQQPASQQPIKLKVKLPVPAPAVETVQQPQPIQQQQEVNSPAKIKLKFTAKPNIPQVDGAYDDEPLEEGEQENVAALIASLRQWLCLPVADQGVPGDIKDPRDMLAHLEVYFKCLRYSLEAPEPILVLKESAVEEDEEDVMPGSGNAPARKQQQKTATGGGIHRPQQQQQKRIGNPINQQRPRQTSGAGGNLIKASQELTDAGVVEESADPKAARPAAPGANRKPQVEKKGKQLSVKNRLMKKLRL